MLMPLVDTASTIEPLPKSVKVTTFIVLYYIFMGIKLKLHFCLFDIFPHL